MQIQKAEDFFYAGNLNLLERMSSVFIIYCSGDIPPQYENDFTDFYTAVFQRRLIIAGGWHSKFEKKIFSRWRETGSGQLIYLTARSLPGSVKYFAKLFSPADPQNYLIIDPYIKGNRISRKTVTKRDDFAKENFINFIFTYIRPGSRNETVFRRISDSAKNIFLYNHLLNEAYMNDQITAIDQFNLDILDCI